MIKALITMQLESAASLLQGVARMFKWAAKHVEAR